MKKENPDDDRARKTGKNPRVTRHEQDPVRTPRARGKGAAGQFKSDERTLQIQDPKEKKVRSKKGGLARQS